MPWPPPIIDRQKAERIFKAQMAARCHHLFMAR
jgi:hypothetical protein